MAGEAKLSMTMDADQVVRELNRLQTANARLQESMQKIKVESVAANTAMGISYREATRLTKEFGDAGTKEIARYKAELEGLRQSQLAGNLSQEEYRKSVQLSNEGHKQRVALLRQEQAEQGRIAGVAKQALAEQMTAADKTKAKVQDLTAAWKTGHLTTEQYAAAVRQAHAAGQQLPGPLASAKGEILGMISGLVAGTASIGAMVGAVKQAYAEAKALREEHRQAQLTVADTQAEAVKMLGPVSLQEASAFLARISDLGAKTGMKDLAPLYQAAADTLSATGSNAELTGNILEALIPLSKSRPQELAPLAGAVGDLATIVGAQSPEEIKRVVSTVIGIAGQGRTVSLASMKESAAAIAGATAVDTGADRQRAVREAAAAFAAIGGGIKDPEGGLTKTATAELAVALQRLLPEKDVQTAVSSEEKANLETRRKGLQDRLAAIKSGKRDVTADDLEEMRGLEEQEARLKGELAVAKKKKDKDRLQKSLDATTSRKQTVLKRALSTEAPEDATARAAVIEAELADTEKALETGVSLRKGTGLQTFGQRLRAVQDSRDLQMRFWEKQAGGKKPTFRGAISPVIRQLLEDRESDVAKRYDEAARLIKDDPADYEAVVRNVQQASPQLQLAEREAAGQSALVQFRQADQTGAGRASTEKLVGEVMAETSTGMMQRAQEKTLGSVRRTWQERVGGWTAEESGMGELLERRAQLVLGDSLRGLDLSQPIVDAELTQQQRDALAKLRLVDSTVAEVLRRMDTTSPATAAKYRGGRLPRARKIRPLQVVGQTAWPVMPAAPSEKNLLPAGTAQVAVPVQATPAGVAVTPTAETVVTPPETTSVTPAVQATPPAVQTVPAEVTVTPPAETTVTPPVQITPPEGQTVPAEVTVTPPAATAVTPPVHVTPPESQTVPAGVTVTPPAETAVTPQVQVMSPESQTVPAGVTVTQPAGQTVAAPATVARREVVAGSPASSPIPAASAAGDMARGLTELAAEQKRTNQTLERIATSNERMAQEGPPAPVGITAQTARGLGSQTQSR